MSACINNIKRTCRLCLMNTSRHKRYELFVKSEVENNDPLDSAAAAATSDECQQNEFSNMILHEKVEYCCGIRLAPKSELPSKICGKCFYMIHMWFNFRQMSCNSQILFSSQTNIKLEDGSIARNSPELQQMRCELLRHKKKKEEIEFITPDSVKDGDSTDNYCIEKVEEVGETDIIFLKETCVGVDTWRNGDIGSVTEKTKATKSNDEELEDYDSQMFTDEESVYSVEEEVNELQEESYSCSKEICVEEALLKTAHNKEEISKIEISKVNRRLIESNDSLNKDKEDMDDEIRAEEEITSSNGGNGTKCFSSTENVSSIYLEKSVKEYSLRDERKIDEVGQKEDYTANMGDNNDCNESDMNTCKAKEDDNSFNEALQIVGDNLSESINTSDCNEDIERVINTLLAESDGEDLEQTNKQSKLENKRVRRKKKKENKSAMRRKANKSVLLDKETVQSENIFPANTEFKKLEKPDKYICNICGNIHKDYLLFTHHMRTHCKEKPYKCEFCNKAFRTPAFLKCHMPVHTGEKRYKCKYCNLHYTGASSRHRHEKTHTDNPNYTCNICGKSFMYKTVLRRHVQLHSGERLYSCAVCNTSFLLPHHLKSHIKSSAHKSKQKSYEALGFKIVFETRETTST